MFEPARRDGVVNASSAMEAAAAASRAGAEGCAAVETEGCGRLLEAETRAGGVGRAAEWVEVELE